jgi:long-chain fatty acid transport protein
VDGEWVQFSTFQSLPLDVQAPPPGLPSSVPENWKDTFTLGIGGDWKFATNWVARASYRYYESPVPDSTFSPTIVDANQNVITVGLGYQYRRHTFELAYSPVFYDKRHIRTSYNPAYNGDYHVTLNLISFAYHFAF